MPLIAVSLPYAASIRDFVHTGVLNELLSIPDVHIDIYTQNVDLPEFDSVRSKRVSLREIRPESRGRIEDILRRLYPMIFHDHFVFVQQVVEDRWAQRLAARTVVAVRKLLGTRRMLKLFAWLLLRLSRRTADDQISGNPDLLIGTRSLISSIDYGLILEACRRGLPQLTAASSWDNFTTKGFFPFPVVKTIVWNRQMAKELTDIFEVPRDHIVTAGYPRVSLLQRADGGEGPADYLSRIGLGRYRRFVLHTASYSELTRGGPGLPPAEYVMIREVATALLPTLPADTCILVRLHPYSRPEDEVVFDGLDRVHVFVPGRQDRFVERVMSVEDEKHLSSQLRLSECIVSMASTITIDALALGRPVINVAFDASNARPPAGSLVRYYDFNHFRDLLRQVRPPLARSVDDVVAFVARCMGEDRDPQADLEAFEHMYVPADSADYAQVVKQTVVDVLGLGRASPRPGPDRNAAVPDPTGQGSRKGVADADGEGGQLVTMPQRKASRVGRAAKPNGWRTLSRD